MKNIILQKELLKKIKEASDFIRLQVPEELEFAVFTGTGLSKALNDFDLIREIRYSDIPHFTEPTVDGHDGIVQIIRHRNGCHIVFCGRHHYYEGYDLYETTFPVRVAQKLNVKKVLLTNASGGLRSDMSEGDICIITDHINLMPDSPIRGLTLPDFGERFPDPKNIYSKLSPERIMELDLKEGVYACLPGPQLETLAELKYLKNTGADLVGMSTIPEVIVANQLNLKVYAVSVITNVVDPQREMVAVLIDDVVAAARKSIPHLNKVIKYIFSEL